MKQGVEYALVPLGLSAAAVFFFESIGWNASHRFVPCWTMLLPWAYALNVLIAAAALVSLSVLTLRPRLSVALGLVGYGSLFVLNDWKLRYLHEPLAITDVYRLGTAAKIAPAYFGATEWAAVAVALLLAAAPLMVRRLRAVVPLSMKVRLVLASGIVAGLAILSIAPERRWFPRWNTELHHWTTDSRFQPLGLLAPFLFDLRYLKARAPEGYSAQTVAERLAPYNVGPGELPAEPPVDIVVLLLESFADVAHWKVRFTRDPLPNLHALQKRFGSLALQAPVFGGGTANTEFEVLTGLPVAALGVRAVIPFGRWLWSPIEAVPSLLRRQGYRTTAIHPNVPTFYHRDRAYPHLGFDRFIDLFAFGTDDPWALTDEDLVDKILAVLDENASPQFVHAVSFASHGPYENRRHDEPHGERFLGEAPEEVRSPMETYLQRVARTDRALASLLRRLSGRKRRTLVVALGDHQPAFANASWGAYIATQDARFEVPLLLWFNDGTPVGTDGASVPAFALAPKILEMAGMALPPPMRALQDAASEVRWHREEEAACRHGEAVRLDRRRWTSDEPRCRRALQTLTWLAYDRLLGECYSCADEKTKGPGSRRELTQQSPSGS